MSIGKRYWEFTHGETSLHKWRNKTLYMPDGHGLFKAGDVVGVVIDTSEMVIVWNPANSPEGFEPMDPEEPKGGE
jgi:hypothetical protein